MKKILVIILAILFSTTTLISCNNEEYRNKTVRCYDKNNKLIFMKTVSYQSTGWDSSSGIWYEKLYKKNTLIIYCKDFLGDTSKYTFNLDEVKNIFIEVGEPQMTSEDLKLEILYMLEDLEYIVAQESSLLNGDN